MDTFLFVKQLPLLNVLFIAVMFVYLLSKAFKHTTVLLFSVSLLPLLAFELGTHLFVSSSNSVMGPLLIVFGINLIPLTFTPLSQLLAREPQKGISKSWMAYYVVQTLLLVFVTADLFSGRVVEWVTGILDQPVILLDKSRRFVFLNTVFACGLTLLCYENTFKNASKPQVEALKCIFIAFLGFLVYFFYVSTQLLLVSYISQSMLLSGAGVIFIGSLLLFFTLLKYPFWEVKVFVSRRVIFGFLSFTAFFLYLVISGSLLDLLQSIRPHGYNILFPAAVFALTALFLLIFLSPNFKRAFEIFVTRHFFRNKYDYRDLWMKFSEKLSGSLNLNELLAKVAEFIAVSILVGQVTIWLRAPNAETFTLEYVHEAAPAITGRHPSLRMRHPFTSNNPYKIYTVPDKDTPHQDDMLPVDDVDMLRKLGIQRIVPVEKGDDILALLGVGSEARDKSTSAEDDRLLSSISNQLADLLLNQQLSDELLLAREWESFNRFSSFVVHDLKNLATLQSMTLENAKELGKDPRFLADAFATFSQTTDNMMNLIAGLSVQRGQFSLKKRPVNLLEILSSTFDELKINQRSGLTVTTSFPPQDKPPMIAGDPDLLKKVFTNVLLNAIQSLPKGQGAVDITVTHPGNGKITTGIKDTGCGIPPEQIKNLFRPFQTTKKTGMGIGLCHTRSIVEVHGGRIHIDSQVNAGTEVEIELPTL
jgi:putative PEP-CTERM system histidine kinase